MQIIEIWYVLYDVEYDIYEVNSVVFHLYRRVLLMVAGREARTCGGIDPHRPVARDRARCNIIVTPPHTPLKICK